MKSNRMYCNVIKFKIRHVLALRLNRGRIKVY